MTLLRQLGLFLAALGVISALAIAAALTPPKTETAQLLILTILLASLLAAGVLTYQMWTADRSLARTPPSKKLPASLATLSSAAILAVYAAGYHRTAFSTNETFSEHSTGRGAALAIAINAASSPSLEPPAPRLAEELPSPRSLSKSKRKLQAQGAAVEAAPKPKGQSVSREAQPQRTFSPPPGTHPIATNYGPTSDAPRPEIAAPAGYQGVPITAPAITPPKNHYKDGTYTGWGTCRHGDIQASVTIQDGKIVSSAITQCLTRYSCSWIANLPGQVVARQSPNVDYVSGASQSTDAFYYAIVDALSKAR